jgi:hypothetical protein
MIHNCDILMVIIKQSLGLELRNKTSSKTLEPGLDNSSMDIQSS